MHGICRLFAVKPPEKGKYCCRMIQVLREYEFQVQGNGGQYAGWRVLSDCIVRSENGLRR